MRYFFTLILGATILLYPKAPSIYADIEKTLKTDKKLQKFHSIVYYPNAINLDFPGYIVGIEKSPKKAVAQSDINYNLKNKAIGVKANYKAIKAKKKALYISHILKYNGCNKESKFLYNLYTKDKKYIPNAYYKSFEALHRFQDDIEKSIKNYDSVIIFVMGWNTSQEEAIRDFKSLYNNFKKASKNQINPLFIGLTWPSEWESSLVPDALVKISSFPVKAKDADELGLGWLGVMLHKSLQNIDKPIFVIGHSFGARATAMATFEGNLYYKDKPYKKRYIHTLISLQGAYSVKRFLSGGIDALEFDISNVAQVVLTSSKYDSAMDSAFWSRSYAGDDKSYNRYCKEEKKFNCGIYTKDYKIEFNRASKITYLECSSIIKNNAYLSGGGAHSDIYDYEMGELLYKIVKLVNTSSK
jgi:hypothetical protein